MLGEISQLIGEILEAGEFQSGNQYFHRSSRERDGPHEVIPQPRFGLTQRELRRGIQV
jgi:hypothetical protein